MAKERRLIDANDVYSLFDKSGFARLHVSDIDTILRVDAVEVVHGHWISKGYKIECSVCEHREFLGTHDPVIHTEEKNIRKYCHNCGAKMDGGSNK